MNARCRTRPSSPVRLLGFSAQQAPTPAIVSELDPRADWGGSARGPRLLPQAQASGLTRPSGRALLRSTWHGARLASCRMSTYFRL
jgi:hypothetical protein